MKDPTIFSSLRSISLICIVMCVIVCWKSLLKVQKKKSGKLKFSKDDRTCKGMLLHHMSDAFLDIYMGYNHARDIWDALDKKYRSIDGGTKRYCVSKCLGFQVEDDKPMADDGLCSCDITLAIGNFSSDRFKGKGSSFKPQGKIQKYKFKGNCFECGKAGHKSRDCRVKKKPNQNPSHLTEVVADPNNFVAVVSEANLTGDVAEWIVDTGATRHICTNKDIFTAYEKIDGDNFFMGNSASTIVQGKGKIAGLKLSFDSDRLVITHNGEFVRQGFSNGGMFTLDVSIEIMNKKASNSSACIAESIDLWSKNEAQEMFLKYKAEVENQLDSNIKRLRNDRGGEYDPNTLKKFCEQNVVIRVLREVFPAIKLPHVSNPDSSLDISFYLSSRSMMSQYGLRSLFPMEDLAVMGILDLLPYLYKIRYSSERKKIWDTKE
ncbi:uncharacterized protein [Spinacia oleracea]|uniref:CCHC-type domain-containing protein n=1 Tax=Spinacia oleracea TaxID=3562 RepID=A0ABM3QY31_SPIOL|nr:uncharacterized protein LOC130463225 [Spinacia oleracea]